MTQQMLDAETSKPKLDIENRIQISVAIDNYIRTERQYFEARKRFDESCSQLKSVIVPSSRLVVCRQWTSYLLTTDAAGDFEIAEIETI